MTEQKYRIGAYVEKETWEKVIELQLKIKSDTGKKPSQGEVIDYLVSHSDLVYSKNKEVK